MDPLEHRRLKNLAVAEIDATPRPLRPVLAAVFGIVVISAVSFYLYGGRSSDGAPAATPAPTPLAANAAPTPPGAGNPAREVSGTIAGDNQKAASAAALPPIKLAPVAPPAGEPAKPAVLTPPSGDTASTPMPTSVAQAPAAAAPAAPAANASLVATPAPVTAKAPAEDKASPAAGLRLDTEFASAKRIVPFAFNKVGVGPRGIAAVKELAPMAKKADKVYVRGRTDGSGTASANRKVAVDRAYTVYKAFVYEGVQKQKLRLTYCSNCFIAANDTEEGRSLNRRVEVEMIMPRDEIARLPKPVHAIESPPPVNAPLAASETLHSTPR